MKEPVPRKSADKLARLDEARAAGREAARRVVVSQGAGASTEADVGTRVHVPALDGIRGLAVLLVMCFHFFFLAGETPVVRAMQKVSGLGWSGVDLFFVLSGFLITGILLDAKEAHARAGSYFRNFYARRTVRIFPLYYAFLILFLLVLPAVLSDDTYFKLFGAAPVGNWAYWTYTYNLFQGHHQGVETFSHALGVTWSLCIEEQFYLVWPAVVWFCRPKTLLKICAGLIATSILSRALVSHYSGYEVFVEQWTICRTDPLAVGAALAILFRTHAVSMTMGAWRLAGLIVLWTVPVAVIAMNLKGGTLKHNLAFQTIGYTLVALMFGALLMLTVTAPARAPIQRVFSNPLLRLFGRVSYAMYLFNQPIKIVLRDYWFDPNTSFVVRGSRIPAQLLFFVVACTLTFAVAWLSWHMFEKHFLKLKDWFPMIGGRGASAVDAPADTQDAQSPSAVSGVLPSR